MVTKSQSRKNDFDLSDSFLVMKEAPEIVGPDVELNDESRNMSLPRADITLPASREDSIVPQHDDDSLLKCCSSVLTQEEAKVKKVAYNIDKGLLLRRWAGLKLG